jgi:hypothetical protein
MKLRYRTQCDYCERAISMRIPEYVPGDRAWCVLCAPGCCEASGYKIREFEDQLHADGALIVRGDAADRILPPEFIPMIMIFSEGRKHRLTYIQIETMIRRRLVTPTGGSLTTRAKLFIP